MMGRKHTQDPSENEDGLQALDEMNLRLHNANQTVTEACRCGAIVVVPKGHEALEDDNGRALCDDCDKPLGVKLYEAFAR